jgi:hypothetical protein
MRGPGISMITMGLKAEAARLGRETSSIVVPEVIYPNVESTIDKETGEAAPGAAEQMKSSPDRQVTLRALGGKSLPQSPKQH